MTHFFIIFGADLDPNWEVYKNTIFHLSQVYNSLFIKKIWGISGIGKGVLNSPIFLKSEL